MNKDIHEAINKVMQEVGYVKKQKGVNLNYTYAGEAALISALRPAMVEHGIYMHVLKIESVTRENYTTAKGTAMVNTVISAIIRFAHVSGTFIDVASTGEGSDAGDKSANKAMTGLYKYAMRQTFCIETGDDPDKFQSEDRKTPDKSDDIITDKVWGAWLELVKQADALKIPHENLDRSKIKKSDFVSIARELREIVDNAKQQSKAGE